MSIRDKKAFALSFILMSAIAVLFWTQSRFPALDDKAQMGQRTNISSIAFDVVVPISAEHSYIERVTYTALNWGYTNWKGMTFGILFAAAFWLFISQIGFFNKAQIASATQQSNSRHFEGSRNSFWAQVKQAFQGGLVGSPMGVCANCSTPIAFGMYQSGRSITASLALISSSPTFNFIVFAMALSLLPLELVLIKYAFVLLFILLVIPLLTTVFDASRFKKTGLTGGQKELPMFCDSGVSHTWGEALSKVGRSYWERLAFVLKGTLPFMILAGVLAAFVAQTVSLEWLGADWSVIGLVICAVLAAFFPVPIAFDVVISAALLAMGVHVAYVAAVFFALSIFSIYPALMIARDVSLTLSASLLAGVALLAIASGLVSAQFYQSKLERTEAHINQAMAQLDMLNETVLAPHLSKSLMRKAARQCHQLGEPVQYQCFERFVIDTLAQQFDVRACVYLEDAKAYRDICENAFEYLVQSRLARVLDQPSECDTLRGTYLLACQYDEVFERVIDNQDVSHCTELRDEESLMNCLNEGLALNFELYENADACQDIDNALIAAKCETSLLSLKEQKAQFYQKDLAACDKLESKAAIQNCKGVTAVNLLEAGAAPSLCATLGDPYLTQRCDDFARYFDAIHASDAAKCQNVREPSLKAECEFASIQKYLARLVSEIQLKQIEIAKQQAQEPVKTGSTDKQLNLNVPALTEQQVDLQQQGVKAQIKLFEFSTGVQKAPHSQQFSKRAGSAFGIEPPPSMRMLELFEPFSYGRGIAVGDWNEDSWPDLVTAHYDEVRLYHNVGGRFERALTLDFENALSPVLVSFVDLNQDNLADLFVSFYGGENRIYWNDQKEFKPERFSSFTLPNSRLVMSLAVEDIDQNGRADLALGSWSYGDLRHFNPAYSQNYVLINQTQAAQQEFDYTLHKLDGAQGETLSILFSDFNGDGQSELVVGNDMDGPDIIYEKQGRTYVRSRYTASLPWQTSFNTMSLSSADFNGDLKLDYFSTDMSFGEDLGVKYCEQAGVVNIEDCVSLLLSEQALQDGRTLWCERLSDQPRADCFQAQLVKLALRTGESKYCDKLNSYPIARQLCLSASEKLPPKPPLKQDDYPYTSQRNVLLLSDADGFTDVTNTWEAGESYWSWNSIASDFDNDTWPDLLIGNGYLFGGSGRNIQSNVFFHNQNGQGFKRAEREFGLNEYLNTPSFVATDFDRDGDLDVIAQRVGAETAVFINHAETPSLQVRLMVNGSEERALGAKIILQTSDGQRLHEIKQGGGFLSFSEHNAHFGLGQGKPVAMTVNWPDGKQTFVKLKGVNKGLLSLDRLDK